MKSRIRFAKLTDGKIQWPPSAIVINGSLVYNPNERILRLLGYKEYVDIRPECDEGFYTEFTGYSEDEMAITVVYQIKEIVPVDISESSLV